jgi:hypothetical protein
MVRECSRSYHLQGGRLDDINKKGKVRINVKLMRVRKIIVAVEKQQVLHFLSVCL